MPMYDERIAKRKAQRNQEQKSASAPASSSMYDERIAQRKAERNSNEAFAKTDPNQWVKEVNSVFNSINSSSNLKKEEESYWAKTYASRLEQLRKTGERYRNFYTDSKSISQIDDILGSISQNIDYLGKSGWSRRATTEQQEDYAAKSKFDLIAGQKEIDDLEAERQKILDEKKSRNAGANGRPYAVGQQDAPDFGSYTTGYGITNNRPYAAGLQVQKQETPEDTRLREIDQLISKKKQYLNQAKHIQEINAYDDTVKNADFDQYDDYVKSDDALYNWINDENFRDSYESNYVNPQQGSVGGSQNHNAQIPAPLKSEFARKGYDRMNANEIAIYNYYYAKSGKEAAQKYLDTIQERLNERVAEDMYGGIKDSTAAKIVFGAAVGLNQFGSNVENFFNTEDDYIAQTAYQLAGGMVREDLADEGKKIGLLGGVSLGQIAYDTISTAANMAPSILASYAVGAAAGTLGLSAKTAQAVGSYTGSAMMGISAAGGAYQQALNEGFDKDQARGYGILVGASEVVMEKFLGGISAVGGNALGINMTKNIANADTALKAIAKRLGGSMISEFGEEYLQEVLEPVFSNIMLKTDKEVKPISAEAIYSGILGMLTGAIMESPSAIYGETKTEITGRKIKKAGGVDSLAKIGNTFAADTVAYKLAGKVNENTGAYTIGQLLREVGATLTEQNVSEIAEALMKEGIGEIAAKKYAKAFAYVVEGGAMPDSLVNAIEADTKLAKAAREVLIDSNTTWNQRTQGYNEVLRKLAMDKVTGKKSGKAAPANDQKMTGKLTAEESSVVENADESSAETAAAPKVSKIQTIEKGKTTVKLDDGTEVDLKDADLDPEDSVRIETIANVDGMTAEDASSIYSILKTAGGKSAQMDALGAKEAYQYGYYGLPESQLTEHAAFANSLTETQRKAVYEIGQKARQKKVENTTFKKSGAPKVAGKVHFDGDRSALNERQQVSLKTMDRIAEILGVQIYVFESKVGKNGKRIGENGWYDPKDGSIHIDLYAGATGEATMLFTLAHELTHYIRKWSPQKFKVLADFLMEEYGKKGVRIESLIREQQNKAKRNGRKIFYDTAYEEVVADSMEMMLSDGNVMKRLEKLKAQDKDLWSQIKRFVDNMAAKIREVYKGLKPDSKEAELVNEMGDTIYRLQELFAEGLVEASENFQSAEKNTTEDGGVKYSDRYLAAKTNSEVLAMVERVAEGTFKANEKIYFGTVADSIAKKIFELTGVNVEGFRVAIEARQVEHILKDHGKEGKSDHSMENPEHLARIEYTLLHPDDMRDAGKTQAYTYFRDGRNRTAPTVLYEKNIGTQSYYVVQAVPDTQAKTLYVVTAFIGKSGYKKEVSQLINAKGPDVTAKTGSVVTSKNSIRGENGVVNNEFVSEYKDSHSGVKFSDRDSDGRQLSKGQQEFFKDSKARNENGNLVALYHSSPTAGFYKFDGGKGEGHYKYGNSKSVVTFFTDRKEMADTYARDNKMVDTTRNGRIKDGIEDIKQKITGKSAPRYAGQYRGYANIKKPYIVDAEGRNWDDVRSVFRQEKYDSFVSITDKEKTAVMKLWDMAGQDQDWFNTLCEMFYEEAGHSKKKSDSEKQGYKMLKNSVAWKTAKNSIGNSKSLVVSAVRKAGSSDALTFGVVNDFKADTIRDYFTEQQTTNDVVMDALKEGIYDGVIIRNVVDYSNHTTPAELIPGNLYITFSPEQFKAWDNTDPTKSKDIRYSDRDTESVSNRFLLANAMESLAKTELEKKKLTEYKAKIDQINAEEQKLSEVRAQIKELSFAKGPRDKEKLRALRDEAIKLSHHIGIYDKQLLRLEASKPLQNVLDREKAKAYQRGKEKGEAALKEYKQKAMTEQEQMKKRYEESRKRSVENRNKTAMRHKIRKTIRELDKLLNRGSKERNVKEGMRDFVAEALASAEVLFIDDYSNEDIIRNGVGCDTEPWESKLIDETQVLMQRKKDLYIKSAAMHEVDDVIAGNTVSFDARQKEADKLDRKIAENMRQLSGVFARERARLNRYTVSSVLENLAKAYKSLGQSDDLYIRAATDEVVYQHLLSLSEQMYGATVKDMTLKQLKELDKAYTMVLTTVQNVNKAMAENIRASIEELAKSTIREVQTVGGSKKYRVSNLDAVRKFDWNNMKPVYAMERIGSSTLTEVFNNVRAGEDTWAKDISEAREYYLEKSKKYGYDKWDFDKKYRFESNSGIPFELTLEQILSLYAYSKREQAADHLRLGGFVFDSNSETYMEKDGKKSLLKYKVNTADAHQITPEIMADIIGKLSKEQTGFVDEMQDYLSTVMGAKGNEVTSKMYGVKLFKEKFYFPLKSAKQFMFEQNEVSGEVRIKNSGFTNKVVAKANNPVILSNFMDVWSGHVNDMSMYHAFTLPLEDFNRVFNYNSPKKDGVESVSVKGTIQDAYSPAAVSYVKQLITDLNGGARTDSTTGVINKLTGMFKKGAVFASLSVVVQQPSAIARAAALVDTKYFIGPKVDQKRHKYLWAEVKKYAPVAIIKEMGYFDTNMGKSTQDFITGKEYSGIKEKAKAVVTDSAYRDELLSKAPALADEYAWCGIWAAVKRETKAKHPSMDTTSEAFLKLCGKRFTEVITKTQVYDSVLARSANMRSKDTGMKMATAFMAEPTTSINMIEDAIWKAKRGDKKYAGKAIGAVIASQILNSILVSFVYAGRDDDEDETYAEKYISALTGSLVDGLNVATYIPFIKDIVSIMQGYDVERSDMAVVSDLWNAWKNLKNDKVSPYRKVENFAGSIAQIFGLPVKNIMRDVRGIYNTITNLAGAEQTTGSGVKYAISGAITGKTVSDKEQLYQARLDGDKQHAARVAARYDDEDSADAAVRAAIKDAFKDGDIDEATATKHMVLYAGKDGSEAHWTMDEWKYQIEKGTSDGYSRYNKIYDAIKNGKSISAAVKEFTSNGYEEKDVLSEVKGNIGEWYRKGEITKQEATSMLGKNFDLDSEEVEDTVKKWSSKVDTGIAYDDIKEEYMDGNITSAKAIDMYIKYGGYDREKAEKKIAGFDFEKKYGFAYDDKLEAFKDGKVSSAEMKSILMRYGNTSEKEASNTVRAYEWMKRNPKSKLDVDAILAYTKKIDDIGISVESSGIKQETFAQYRKLSTACEGTDSNGDGKTDYGSVKNQKLAVIDDLPITKEQKDVLYFLNGWAASGLYKAPWH